MKFDQVISMLTEGFPGKAWVYAVQHHNVQIGIWNGSEILLEDGYSPEHLLELRIFTNQREMRVVRANANYLLRDSETLDLEKVVEDRYIMYGERISSREKNYSALKEERGGELWFPADILDNFKNLKLGVRNFYRYNPIPVLATGKEYDEDMEGIGKGALEFYDYTFTGFYDAENKEVIL